MSGTFPADSRAPPPGNRFLPCVSPVQGERYPRLSAWDRCPYRLPPSPRASVSGALVRSGGTFAGMLSALQGNVKAGDISGRRLPPGVSRGIEERCACASIVFVSCDLQIQRSMARHLLCLYLHGFQGQGTSRDNYRHGPNMDQITSNAAEADAGAATTSGPSEVVALRAHLRDLTRALRGVLESAADEQPSSGSDSPTPAVPALPES